ncbi:MAG: PKD domain-containing protein [Bacteroidota bacterium]
MNNVQATHIVGAELFYECTDPANSRYTITLKLYRDCLAGQAPFDSEITVFAFSSQTGQAVRYLNIPLPLRTPEIVPEEWDVCVGRPYNICVQEGVYQARDVYLPPIAGGYDLGWARCCRNQAITNLESPLSEGVTYLAHVPGPEDAECNSMPQFVQFPPIFLCAGETFNFDHSAIDPDGDSLSYDLTNPYTGINIEGLGAGNPREGGNDPIVDRFENPMGPPPYQNVVFRQGFSFRNPFGASRANQNFQIDPLTGYITATPEQPGIFVLSISVFEWRNGVLLSENRRDFQIHVINCQEQDVPPVITHDLGDLPSSGDTIIIEPEVPFCYDINVTDPNIADRLTAFPISAEFGNGFAFAPLATFEFVGRNPLDGEVCWQPACEYAGQTIPLVVGARDLGDCPTISNVFDTVWVRVLPPPNDAPEIVPDLSGNDFVGDTLFVQAGGSFCYTFSATDINATDSLTLDPSPAFRQPGGPTLTFEGANPLTGEVCWETSCGLVGQIVPLRLGVFDDAKCPSQKSAESTIFVKIEPPENDPPTIIHDLSGLNSSNDTVFVSTDEAFCYNFSVVDVNLEDSLMVEPLSPIFGNDSTLTIEFSGENPIEGQICWMPNCTYEDAVIPLVLSAFDNGLCGNELRALDTVFINVQPQEGLAPVVGFELGDLAAQGDTLVVEAGDSICMGFFIADLTPETGLNYDIRFEVLDGTELSLGDLSNLQVSTDSVTGEVCFKPDCSNGGSLFRLVLEGVDDKFCEPFPQTSDTLFIKVNTDLEVVLGADLTVCEGTGGAMLEANIVGADSGVAEFTYVWDCTRTGRCGISDINAETPVVNPSRTTTYFLQVTDQNGCTSEIDSFTLEVLPQPFIDVNADRTLCTGDDSVSLDVIVLNDDEVPGPYTYEWFPKEGLSDPTIAEPRALPDTSTIYTVVVIGDNGCSSASTNLDEASTTVVSLLPTPVANAGPDMNVCEGDSITLLGSITGDPTDVVFTWSLGAEVVGSGVQNLTISPTTSELYVLSVENGGCEGISDSVLVSYHLAPTLSSGEDYEVCAREPLELTIEASLIADSTSEFTYQWEPMEGISDFNSPSPTVVLENSETLRVSATSAIGCTSSTLEIPVLVNSTPLAEAGPDAFACGDEPVQLDGSLTFLGEKPDSSLLDISWTPETGLSLSDTLNPMVIPERSTLYYLTLTQGNCSTTDSVLVDLFLSVDAEASADTNLVCGGTEVRLSVVGGNGSPNFAWAPAEILDDPTSAQPVATPDSTTTFVVTLNEQGCSAIDSITVEVRPGPVGTLEASATSICPNTSVDFMAITQGLEELVWDFGDGTSSTEMTPSYLYEAPGIYMVSLQGRTAEGCLGIADQLQVEVLEGGIAAFGSDPDGSATIVDPELTIDFVDESTGAVSYDWNFGDGDSSIMANPTHTFEKEGSYEIVLTITDAGGCTDTDTLLIDLRRQTTFFPNVFTPNADGVLDSYISRYSGTEAFQMQIFDRWGKLMFESNDPEAGWDGTAPDGKKAEDGVYFYIAEIADDVFKGHITLMR